MSWTKTSDDFSDDCWSLSDGAYRLHHEGLTWSNRKLLDCHIPRDDIRRFARHGDLHLPELLEKGFWRELGNFLVIIHHAAYQRTREAVIKQQEANATNGRKGGRPPKPPREVFNDPSVNPVANPVASPPENRKGQDRTGVEVRAVDSELVDHDDPRLPDDPDLRATDIDTRPGCSPDEIRAFARNNPNFTPAYIANRMNLPVDLVRSYMKGAA